MIKIWMNLVSLLVFVLNTYFMHLKDKILLGRN